MSWSNITPISIAFVVVICVLTVGVLTGLFIYRKRTENSKYCGRVPIRSVIFIIYFCYLGYIVDGSNCIDFIDPPSNIEFNDPNNTEFLDNPSSIELNDSPYQAI